MKRIGIVNMGCKVNRFDWQQAAAQLDADFVQVVGVHDEADLYIVNSCTVTQRSGSGSLKALRQIARQFPSKPIIFTGCHASINPDSGKNIDAKIHVLSNAEKNQLPDLLARLLDDDKLALSDPQPVVSAADLSRPVLRVQDGCDQRCTYCIIPDARGPSRSFSLPWILQQVHDAVENAVPELVLTGIHLGDYGHAQGEDKTDLAGLVRRILDDSDLPRLRLSSIEPPEWSPALLDMLAHEPRLCRYAHVPIQSGSDRILQAMHRPYTRRDVQDLIVKMSQDNARVAIGADIIVGFPGETEQDFQDSLNLLSDLPLAYLHVFPFSARLGTPAASMADKVPDRMITQRAAQLRDLSKIKRQKFYQAQLNTEFDLVIERPAETVGWMRGTSDHYLDVQVQTAAQSGELIRVRLSDLEPEARAVHIQKPAD